MPDSAITPYNFVCLPNSVLAGEALPPRDCYDAQRNTGWFEIKLTLLTPAYTRAPEGVVSPDEWNQESFFHYGDSNLSPVLPGSSLRGMFRSVFEILTCSRLEFLGNRNLYYRFFASKRRELREYYSGIMVKGTPSYGQFRTDRLTAGILRRDTGHPGGWSLHVSSQPTGISAPTQRGFVALPVSDIGLNTIPDRMGTRHPDLHNSPNGRPVYQSHPVHVSIDSRIRAKLLHPPCELEVFQARICRPTDPSSTPGYLIVPGKDIRRRFYQIVLEAQATTIHPLSPGVYDDYLEWGRLAHGGKFLEDTSSRQVPRRLKDGEPAFALLDGRGNVVAIGANMMLALRYESSIRDVAEASYTRKGFPLLDMTQSVFGCVTETDEGGAAVKGRVFFEDATCGCASKDASLPGPQPKVPDILASPKPTSFKTYLEQPGGHLRHWDSKGTTPARIRGFKRYWHRSPEAALQALQNNLETKKETQQTKIRPVKAGIEFTSRVHFENLTYVELGALYASLFLPETMGHKFGMGKNLGLGSMQVCLSQAVLFKMPARYQSLLPESGVCRHGVAEGDASLEVQQTLHRAYNAFVEHINRVEPNGGSLWGSDRMRSFAALLSFPPLLPDRSTRQISFDRPLREDASRLANWLGAPGDALSRDLVSMLSQNTQQLLQAHIPFQPIAPALSAGLNADIRRIVASGMLDVHLYVESLPNDGRNEVENELRRASRDHSKAGWVLLEEAFPSEDRQWSDPTPLQKPEMLIGSERWAEFRPKDIFPVQDSQGEDAASEGRTDVFMTEGLTIAAQNRSMGLAGIDGGGKPADRTPTTRSYRERQEVPVTVLEKVDFQRATVRLEDGTGTVIHDRAAVGMAQPGEKIKMKVAQVDRHGNVLSLRR